ncbi:GGDEF domain-containing protein [soil metagenome]
MGQPKRGLFSRSAALRLAEVSSVVLAVVVIVALVVTAEFRLDDALLFGALMACGTVTSLGQRWLGAQGRRPGAAWVDLQSVWILATVLLLPPVYAVLAPLALEPSASRGTRGRWSEVTDVASFVLAAAAAVVVAHLIAPDAVPLTSAVAGVDPLRLGVAAAAAAVTFTAINAATIAEAVRWETRGRRLDILGGPSGIAVEFGTQCTGALVAAAWAQGWAYGLVTLPPLVLLQRSLRHTELLQAARTDAKTGLANSSYWLRLGADQARRGARSGTPMAVALIDLDHFKRVNDRHGHLVGDEALCAVSRELTDVSRPGDVVSRFGGEEFAVLMTDTTRQDAPAVADRLRRAVAATTFLADSSSGEPLTASVGLAHSDDLGWDCERLLRAADTALYEAKASGRNRVVLATGDVERMTA